MIPFFSIIIPVYNVEKYLAACLDSVLNQDFTDFEIICVNDGSTDASDAILKDYQKRDSRICIITQKNRGLSEARNTGIENACGKYICFVDSDDMLSKGALRVLWNAVQHDKEIQIVGYEVDTLLFENSARGENADREHYYKVTGNYPGVREGKDFFTDIIENDDFIESASLMLIDRMWLLDQNIKFFPGAYFEDSAFALECYFAAKRMIHIKNGLYIYRVRDNSIMTSRHTFQHEKWRIWQYGECLRHIYMSAQTTRQIEALAKYARQIMGNIKCIYDDLDLADRERVNNLTSVDGLIAESLGLNPARALNRDLALEGLLSVIKRKEKILLYGAGVVGGKLLKLLKREHIQNKVCGFAISSEPDLDSGMRDGIVVKYIGEYASEDVDLLVISSCKYYSEMVKKAKELGFSEILLIDHNMEHAIDRRLSGGY